MYKKISKILICAMILVLAVGAVSAMENATADDVVALDVADDVVAVSEDDVDVVAVEEEGDDIVAVVEEDAVAISEDVDMEVVAVSEEKEDTLAVSENGGAVGIDEGQSAVSLSTGDDNAKLSNYGSYKYKVFTIGKFKFPYKYINTKYDNLPYKWQKVYNKRLTKFNKKMTKKLQKIKAKGWMASGNPTTSVLKKGSNAIIIFRLACYKY